jgi:hypothetical protein
MNMETESQIIDELKKLNETADKILAAVTKEPSKGQKIVDAVATSVTIGGIVAIVAQIIQWVGGK